MPFSICMDDACAYLGKDLASQEGLAQHGEQRGWKERPHYHLHQFKGVLATQHKRHLVHSCARAGPPSQAATERAPTVHAPAGRHAVPTLPRIPPRGRRRRHGPPQPAAQHAGRAPAGEQSAKMVGSGDGARARPAPPKHSTQQRKAADCGCMSVSMERRPARERPPAREGQRARGCGPQGVTAGGCLMRACSDSTPLAYGPPQPCIQSTANPRTTPVPRHAAPRAGGRGRECRGSRGALQKHPRCTDQLARK